MKTFEQIVIDKLKEIEPATQKEWASAMGYTTKNFWYIIKKLKKLDLVEIDTSRQPYRYKVNEEKEEDSKYK